MPRPRHRRDQGRGRRRVARAASSSRASASASRRRRPARRAVGASAVGWTPTGVADSSASRAPDRCATDGELVSPLNIPAWRDFPLRDELRATHSGVRVRRRRRRARARARRGPVRRGARLRRLPRRWSSRRASAAGSSSTAASSTGRTRQRRSRRSPDRRATAGPRCACGARGCLEAEASGPAIEAVTGRRARRDADAATRDAPRAPRGTSGRDPRPRVLDFDRCFVGGSVALGFGDDVLRRRPTEPPREVARAVPIATRLARSTRPGSAPTAPSWARRWSAWRDAARDALVTGASRAPPSLRTRATRWSSRARRGACAATAGGDARRSCRCPDGGTGRFAWRPRWAPTPRRHRATSSRPPRWPLRQRAGK